MTDHFCVNSQSHARARLVRLALLAGALAGSAALGGCSSRGPHPDKMAQAARDALTKGDAEHAVSLAEAAVLADGRNPATRLTLANAYLRAGRFESARTAFSDAIGLGDDSSRAALGLVLADLAQGHNNAALDTLNTYSDVIPAADLGLALVMAGQNQRGIEMLAKGIRQGQNTPKMRQNLAYAYALSGLWSDARVMAGQDLPADQVDARLQQWAQMARPEDAHRRVASLLAVPMRDDTGQPEALALSHFPAPAGTAPVEQAAAQPAAPALVVQTPTDSGALARIDLPASTPVVTAPAAIAAPAPAPTPAAKPHVAPAPRRVAAKVAAPVRGGTHMVQLGAFGSEEAAHRAWTHYAKRDPRLAQHASLIARAVVHGKTFWRVQATGFANQMAAQSLCGPLKAHGGACLVMAVNSANRAAAPVQTAAAKPATQKPSLKVAMANAQPVKLARK